MTKFNKKICSEIYKTLFFEKTYNEIIISTQNNLIIIIGSAKQYEAQINI